MRYGSRVRNGSATGSRKKKPVDSSKFMNVPQLAESLLEKLLGIDINLSKLAGAVSGPGDGVTIDENGNMTFADNVVDYYVDEDGRVYTVKDYTFINEDTGMFPTAKV